MPKVNKAVAPISKQMGNFLTKLKKKLNTADSKVNALKKTLIERNMHVFFQEHKPANISWQASPESDETRKIHERIRNSL